MKRYRFKFMLGLTALLLVAGGFIIAPREIRRNIDAGKARLVKTDITFPAGRLYISPDARDLCEGVYRFRDELWEPEITYREESGTGYLDIDVEDNRNNKHYDDSDQNVWEIAFNKDIRNEFQIEMIAGESEIDLQGCRIDRFEFEMVAGKSFINLRNSSVPFLEFKAVAGEAEIDLTGDWKNDLDAIIKGGVGELTVLLPRSTGVKVSITGGLGEIDAPGFDKDNRVYTNELYGKTRSSLYLDIKGGIGNVTLKMERSTEI
jgi:hypothetical protein